MAKFYTSAQVAQILEQPMRTVIDACEKGTISPTTIIGRGRGSRRLFSFDDLLWAALAFFLKDRFRINHLSVQTIVGAAKIQGAVPPDVLALVFEIAGPQDIEVARFPSFSEAAVALKNFKDISGQSDEYPPGAILMLDLGVVKQWLEQRIVVSESEFEKLHKDLKNLREGVKKLLETHGPRT